MRRLALLGLVVSLLLGGVAVLQTSESVSARRDKQDRLLQAAVSNEVALISGSQRQTATALSLMLVNPAVAQLLNGREVPAGAHRTDVTDTTASLAAVQRSSLVSLTAACLDNDQGRQLACSPSTRAAVFPLALGRQFAAIANGSAAGGGSRPFISPVSGQRSVAFVEPIRAHGKTLGLVHLDMGILTTRGSSLFVEGGTPDVHIQMGSYAHGKISLGASSGGPSAREGASARTIAVPGDPLGPHPQSTLDEGHRAMVAVLPMGVGGTHQNLAVVASESRPDPDFLNAWSAELLTVLATAILVLLCSIAGLVVSNRRVVRELTTDDLTGLRNRRALIEDLPRVCQRASEQRPAYVWFFDLNGFKNYNDSFGHIAGDSLLSRLGARLREVLSPHGTVYRLGGDEFCALITHAEDPHALFLRARDALSEQGGAFTVTCAAGAVEIPRETSEPMHALRLADQHMYREKATSHGGAAELITAVLHAALAQRHPDLGEHSDDVAGDVELLARTIGLDEEAIGLIVKAGDLHDVGKLGIPDEILAKPGPLNDEEWQFMKQHTLMGESIIAAAGPSLDRIGPLVRASHERWDGRGYPDGLAEEEIPLGARIITICDSFHAMLDERVYKRAMSLQDALSELRRCAGTQFDPQLVEVFCRLVSERTDPRAPLALRPDSLDRVHTDARRRALPTA
jgi:diguanylate cyclase (GGDEF)-like protein